MTSQVLYRKWRPRSFQAVVGQEPVIQTLRHALQQERVAHAYLFCGPRGTGKTTTARILAKAVNCQASQDGEPCDDCQSCRTIAGGQALDLIEVDAASNRGIDDIRALRERVHYAPSESRYKVYIIDEVHMLTEAAFNALLKTLEEPPPHVILVLATTEPHKVPATIISRCQRFDFRRISASAMIGRLQELCSEEGLEASEEALQTIVRQASGSLRDAINLLEQLSVSYGSSITLEHVRDLLGLGGEEQALVLVEHLLRGETREGLQLINQVTAQGIDLRQFHRGVVEYLRAALLLKSKATDAVEQSTEAVQRLTVATSQLSIQRVLQALQLFSQRALQGEPTSPLSLEVALVQATLDTPAGDARPGGIAETEVALEEMPKTPPSTVAPAPSQQPPVRAAETPLQPVAETPAPAPTSESFTEETPKTPPQPVVAEASTPVQLPQSPAKAPPVAGSLAAEVETRWAEIVKALSKRKGKRFFIGALMRDSRSHRLEGQTVVLSFVSKANMERLQEELDSPEGKLAIREVLTEILGTPLELRAELDESQRQQGNDGNSGHLVRATLRMGARIVSKED